MAIIVYYITVLLKTLMLNISELLLKEIELYNSVVVFLFFLLLWNRKGDVPL